MGMVMADRNTYTPYVICAILWMLVLTPKVIMYTVEPSGYKYPLCISSTLSLYSLTNTLCLLHSQHLQVGCISLISCTLMAAQQYPDLHTVTDQI
jgi:hypothetical protein